MGQLGGEGNDIPTNQVADVGTNQSPETALIHSVQDVITVARQPDTASGPFGAVAERDQFNRPLHVQTAQLDFSVAYAPDGEIGQVTWNSAGGATWTRRTDGNYDMGNGEIGKNLRIEPRTGTLTWQNTNGQAAYQFPDGHRWVEGKNRADKAAAA